MQIGTTRANLNCMQAGRWIHLVEMRGTDPVTHTRILSKNDATNLGILEWPDAKRADRCRVRDLGQRAGELSWCEVQPRANKIGTITLRHFLVHTVAHELLNVDGTLWRTLRLLFVRPGRLSLEYAAGRRRPYVNPFRLLLIALIAYTLMTASGLGVTLTFGPSISIS